MEGEKFCLNTFFKPVVQDIKGFYLDIINHVHLEIHRVLNEGANNYGVDICIENEYAKDFLLRVEDRIVLIKKGYNCLDIEEYIIIKYHLPTFNKEDKLEAAFMKKLVKANYKILCALLNLEIVNTKGRPKMFEELKTIKKQAHTLKMKEYMKSKYDTYTVVNNNLLTLDEYKEIEKCNLREDIKKKIKLFTKSFIKKE